jgi:hypothetical protein
MVIRTVRHRLLVISCRRAAQTDTVPESLGTPAPLKATPSRQPRIVQLASKILINNRDRIQMERWQPGWLVGCPLLTKLRGTNSCHHKPSTGQV